MLTSLTYANLKMQFGELLRQSFLEDNISISQAQEFAEFFSDHFNEDMNNEDLKMNIVLMKLHFPKSLTLMNKLSYA